MKKSVKIIYLNNLKLLCGLNVNRKYTIILSFLLFLIFFFESSVGFAEGLSVQDIVVSGEKNEVRLSSVLRGDIDDDITETIKSGIPITFTYHVELHRKKAVWFDTIVLSMTIKNTVKYDNLKKEYKLTQTVDKEIQESISKDIQEVKQWMRRLDKVKIAGYSELEYDKTYYIKVKAELKSIKFIFPLNYVLFFFSFFDEDTSWHNSPLFVIKKSLKEQ